MHQLARLVPVHRVVNLTRMGDAIERELALVKVIGKGDHRVEALRLAQAFSAKTVDATLESFVCRDDRHARRHRPLHQPDDRMRPRRSGPHRLAALARGKETM